MKRFIYLLLINCIAIGAMAVPARRNGIEVRQADGSSIMVYQQGDEYFHWTTNAQGEWIERNEKGMYETIVPLTDNEIMARRKSAAPRFLSQNTQTASPLNLAPRGLIILVNFTDKTFTYSKEEITNMLTGDHWSREYDYTYKGKNYHSVSNGSARKYFIDQSKGQYQPQFDIAGPYTVSKDFAYYGKNQGSFDAHPEEMIVEACRLANRDGFDFSNYDADGNGVIDFVYVIYAGYGEADSYIDNTIWPHSYTLSERYYKRQAGRTPNDTVYLNGKKLDLYACGNEVNYVSKQLMGIGNFCHEFGHVLGLPDLYESGNYSSFKTPGQWDIMDYGIYNNDCNTPPAYSAYERFFLGWLKPTLLNQPADITLYELQAANAAGIITETGEHNLIGNDPYPFIFYMLENRQQTAWDSYLPGSGMIITKVTYKHSNWSNNCVNNSVSDMGVDLIEADGKIPTSGNDYYGKTTDAFPAGNTEYLAVENFPITDISVVRGVIHFKFMGGGENKNLDIHNLSADEPVVAIYDLMGRRLQNDIDQLPDGAYIVLTEHNAKKVIIRNR